MYMYLEQRDGNSVGFECDVCPVRVGYSSATRIAYQLPLICIDRGTNLKMIVFSILMKS